ncbi:MAG: UDP-N-acetylmuramoyl-L-alanine--D-glutamate ligase [Clostridiales bacterium]|jgi:UDP-N-acetylmuramoylalanine--D-glutamate ligase|nr:UDP-N-acetylmuramoyl-L-alanine--D-glutamate ligase [Clostridiales bacterium]
MEQRVQEFFRGMRGKRVAFCGIGGSNLPLVKIFHEYGALVTACDRRSREALGEAAKELEAMGVALKLGDDYLQNLDVDVLFRTPGMRFHLPELDQARQKGIAVTSEMEVFFALCPCKIYAVTGSDGKTTTTTILSELLKAAGKRVHLGGNIGRPLLPDLELIQPEDVAVVELSSFQLISMHQSPHVAVVTNLSPNHLDIHKDMAEYVEAKKNIFLHQDAFSKTVLNLENEWTRSFGEEVRGQRFFFSSAQPCEYGAWLRGDTIVMQEKETVTEVVAVADIKIPGKHNIENYLAAITAAWGDVNIDHIKKVAKEFGGVPHRAELVRVCHGVSYYNDSIGTSPTRTASGTLSLYDQKILLIAGGYDKKIPFDNLGPVIVDKVKTLILMGATAPKIQAAVEAAPAYTEGCPKILHAASMEEAVTLASQEAQAGDIVSLSPACASFDQYPNFEARGNHFKELVHALI